MIPEPWIYHVPKQAEKSQGLGTASSLALVRFSGDLWGNQPCTQFLLPHMGHLYPTDPHSSASPGQEKNPLDSPQNNIRVMRSAHYPESKAVRKTPKLALKVNFVEFIA